MNVKTALGKLAEIRTGYSFRTRIENDPLGTVRVLQISDVRADSGIDPAGLPLVQWPVATAPPLLKAGDVVMPARGDHYETVTIKQVDQPMVASGPLFVMTPESHAVIPGYLCWYLQQRYAQSFILKNRAGTNIPSLSRKALARLPVAVPALDVQKKLVELSKLWKKQQLLVQRLLINRQQLLDGISDKLLES